MKSTIRRVACLGILGFCFSGLVGCGSSTSPKTTNTAASTTSAVQVNADGSITRTAVSENAITTFSEAIKSAKSNPAMAIDLFKKAAKEDSNFAEAWYNVGLLEQERGNTKEAMEAYETTLKMRPDMASAYTNIARLQIAEGKFDEAVTTLNKVIDDKTGIDPFNVEANLNMGMIYRHRGEAILERDSGGVEKQFSMSGSENKGEIKNKEAYDLFAQAVVYIRRALVGDSNNIYCYENLSAIYYLMNSLEVARLVTTQAKLKYDEYNNALKEKLDAGRITPEEYEIKVYQPKDLAAIYNTSGLIYLAEGEVSLGNAEFKQAVALDPDSVPAMLNVAGIAVNVQDYPLALEQYEKVLTLEPNNIEAYLSKAVALRGLDRLDEAEKIYRDIISKHPEYPQAQFNLNVLYQEYYQKTDEARAMWAAFVENPQAQKIIPGRVEEAKTRIKQIDETKAAAEKAAAEAARMQAEMEELERMAREAEAAEAAEAAQSGDSN